jgi:hypothetical protein
MRADAAESAPPNRSRVAVRVMRAEIFFVILLLWTGSVHSQSSTLLRGVFRDPNDGRPVGMWTLNPATRAVQMLDGAGNVVGSGVIGNTAIVRFSRTRQRSPRGQARSTTSGGRTTR